MSKHLNSSANDAPKNNSYTHYFLSLLIPIVPSIYTPCTLTGFLALLLSTCSNYMLAPIRDATALSIGVQYIPRLTLASTFLALVSSVPIGWLFEAPDPSRRAVFKKLGLTRGETQGSSLALFYRMFAIFLFIYSFAEKCAEMQRDGIREFTFPWLRRRFGTLGYVVFFLVVHLMKLHSISLVWGVTSEAMEYEEAGEDRRREKNKSVNGIDIVSRVTGEKREGTTQSGARLKRLAFVGFGGTLGGILGSIIVSFAIHILRLSGLLLLASILLLISANLSLELGNIMHKYWSEEQQILLLREQQQQQKKENQLNGNNTESNNEEPDISLKRVSSSSSMKRISSGNSLQQSVDMKKSASTGSLLHGDRKVLDDNSSSAINGENNSEKGAHQEQPQSSNGNNNPNSTTDVIEEDTFRQRLLRGITTILRSKLLMSIFTYNALYSSTSTLLSFKRAQLVVDDRASRTTSTSSTTESHTAFLAKINFVSSISVFLFQISGIGAGIAHYSGMRGTLAILPLIRLIGVIFLFWYEYFIGYQTNLFLFLLLDEFCKVVNLAIAKPVRESLWRGLSVEARYEAKPIVDTLANRWGGGSAAFLVQCMNWTFSKASSNVESKSRFGLLILCLVISAWWCMVSLHLGAIRQRIDVELKKRQ